MIRLSSNALTFTLIGTGAAAWFAASRPLAQDSSLLIPSNPLGIKRSPYGEVFAMAMQGPIDTYWHGAEECTDENCTDPSHHGHHHAEEGEDAHAGHDHDHDHSHETEVASLPSASLGERYSTYLNALNEIADQRTNPKPVSDGQRFARRRAIERKLRFAYELDPAHYGNYNTYHLFLTEPRLGTRPELTPGAAKLAEETIAYCLRRDDDPRPSLTAASAAHNELQLMFLDAAHYPTSEMRKVMTNLDISLARHQELTRRWMDDGTWGRLSPQRQEEISERHRFAVRLRDADEATILRLEGKTPLGQVSN